MIESEKIKMSIKQQRVFDYIKNFGSITTRECLLFGMGYGTDQAAELRYEIARLNRAKNKKTADV